MMDFSGLKESIEAFDSIVIFRHINPDGDASGSQSALKTWLKDNYPEKDVYAAGSQVCTQGVWPANDEVSDEVIRKSLAVVLDTAAANRCDDSRFENAAKIIRIDHHPDRTPYGDLSFVNEKAAAACQILAEWFEQQGKHMSSKCAEYLYKGILTDTLRFSTSNTTPETLKAAAWLTGFGIDIPAINRELFDLSMDEFRLTSAIRAKVNAESSGFAWLIMSEKEMESFGVNGSEARGHIDEIGHVRDFRIWAMFTENRKDGVLSYDASLRSKKTDISIIAQQFGGGGHKNASGVKGLSEADLYKIKELLNQAAENENRI